MALLTPMERDLLRALHEAGEERRPAVLATVVKVEGASPAQPGFKMLIFSDGTHMGNIGGGALEQHVVEDAADVLGSRAPRLAHYSLTEEGPDALGMLCGGDVTVFFEPFLPQPTLLIVGGGNIGRPLAELAALVGYAVEIVDVVPARGDRARFEPEMITDSTYVVIITEDHRTDEEALRKALRTPAAYIGMIGSLRKVRAIFQDLEREGFSKEELARVRAPIGLDTGGRQPAEIALAILAEMECVRHGGDGRPRVLLRMGE